MCIVHFRSRFGKLVIIMHSMSSSKFQQMLVESKAFPFVTSYLLAQHFSSCLTNNALKQWWGHVPGIPWVNDTYESLCFWGLAQSRDLKMNYLDRRGSNFDQTFWNLSFSYPRTFWKCNTKLVERPFKVGWLHLLSIQGAEAYLHLI